MNKAKILLTGSSLLAASIITLRAQEAATSSTAPDSIVQLTAESHGLTLQSPDAVPTDGAFWIVTSNGVVAPFPFLPPACQNVPVYAITDGAFLVDASGGQVDVQGLEATTTAEALTLLAGQVENVITQTQAGAARQQILAMTANGMETMAVSSGFTPAFNFSTDSLWLEITGITNGMASLILNNATNQVYEVLSKTDLTATNWSIEPVEVWPTNSTAMPFTVPVLDRTNALFIWAMDWTDVTENGNTVPDWWFWKYFQSLALSDTTWDGHGHTLSDDYLYGLDPNPITFSLSVTNQHVNMFGAPMQLNVTAGIPFYFAVLVDSTNFAAANWTAYGSSNITANLGSVEGWRDVWIGLRGLPSDAQQTWENIRLKLDFTPPWLTLTNPVTNVVCQPMIELQGYSPEALASISYDLTNTAGLVANQDVLVLNQCYDTNSWELTVNTFQAFDIPLTNGLNLITVLATDLAGNVMTTNFGFTLDYSGKTNPPAMQITWPTNGTQISGTNFTLDGHLDDFTATISASVTSTNGNTTMINGLVERDGRFWIENIPLNAGTNTLTFTVADAVGNTTVTNISVIQSPLVLKMDPVADSSKLWQATVNLTGKISDAAYAVWVNGVKGTNNGNGTWSAGKVPTTPGGTATFTITAYAPGEMQPNGSTGN